MYTEFHSINRRGVSPQYGLEAAEEYTTSCVKKTRGLRIF